MTSLDWTLFYVVMGFLTAGWFLLEDFPSFGELFGWIIFWPLFTLVVIIKGTIKLCKRLWF